MSKPHPYKTPTKRPGDSKAMREAINWLTAEGVDFISPTTWQLKIGNLSFYPDKAWMVNPLV